MLNIDPIGFFHTTSKAAYDVPRQAVLSSNNEGIIQLKKGCQYEQALQGLEGFDRIWVIFHFHLYQNWKPKVLPPRGGKKQGVFATRSPHRPNFIGLSCVQLQSIKGLQLFIVNHDLIDGTPIIDIKPYLNYADAFNCNQQGWLDDLPVDLTFKIQWSLHSQSQLHYLLQEWSLNLQERIENRLYQSPLPYAYNRVKNMQNGYYQLAFRTWRIYYILKNEILHVNHLESGYDLETLQGDKISKWDDVLIHQAFVKRYGK